MSSFIFEHVPLIYAEPDPHRTRPCRARIGPKTAGFVPDLWVSWLLAIYAFRQFRRVWTCAGTLHSNRGHRPAPARSRSIRQIVCGGAGVVISPATPVAARRQSTARPADCARVPSIAYGGRRRDRSEWAAQQNVFFWRSLEYYCTRQRFFFYFLLPRTAYCLATNICA